MNNTPNIRPDVDRHAQNAAIKLLDLMQRGESIECRLSLNLFLEGFELPRTFYNVTDREA